jgi:hypothetical protein
MTPIFTDLKENLMLARMWVKRNPHKLLMEMKINTTTIEKYMEVPQKTKNRTAI